MPPQPNQPARAAFWLQVASLVFTGWVTWKIAFFPFGAQNYLPEGIAIALLFSIAALAVSAGITFLLLLTVRHIARDEALNLTLRTCAAGMWFAPAVILLSASSPLAITAALALVVSATRVLYSQWSNQPLTLKAAEPLETAAADGPEKFITGELPHGFLPRDFLPAFTAAAALQAGFAFSHLAMPMLSAVCYALGASVLTAYAIAAGVWTNDRTPTLPRSVLAVAVTLMLTVLITVIGMGMYPEAGGGEAGYGASNHPSTHHALPPPPPPPDPARRRSEPPPIDPARLGPAVSVPGGVPGVILWPETEPVPILVEPMPKGGLANRSPSHPFVIPFSGSYWMFRAGFTRPPANSLVRRGIPTTDSFKTVDNWPLEMEAHQRLDREIDLSCCSMIRVDVLNADKQPNTITIELGLIHKGGPPFRLGPLPVRSVPDVQQDPIRPVAETLDFVIPSSKFRFDEFDVIFHRDRMRVDHSARIAIQRFVLVPR